MKNILLNECHEKIDNNQWKCNEVLLLCCTEPNEYIFNICIRKWIQIKKFLDFLILYQWYFFVVIIYFHYFCKLQHILLATRLSIANGLQTLLSQNVQGLFDRVLSLKFNQVSCLKG